MALLLIFAFIYGIIHKRHAKKEKAYALKLEKMNQELTVANNTQKRFLQNMSHEIRTPLNAICGFSAVLADKNIVTQIPQEERDMYANQISENTKLMLALVDDVLVMGDIESKKYKKRISSQVVHKLIDSSMSAIMARVVPGVTLRYDDLLPDGFTIDTDENRTKQVVLNFLTNACKHTSEGEIVVTTELMYKDEEEILKIAVTNTGDRIPEDKAEIIFQRFEKLNDFKQGTGLGLPICREIANLFNGSVYLDTTYTGNGNRFVFEHPLISSDTTE